MVMFPEKRSPVHLPAYAHAYSSANKLYKQLSNYSAQHSKKVD